MYTLEGVDSFVNVITAYEESKRTEKHKTKITQDKT